VRVCFVVQRYGDEVVGGAEKYVAAMATGLAADGHDVRVVTSCATNYSDWADEYEPGTHQERGVTIHRLPVRSPRDNDRFIPLHLRAVDTSLEPMWPWAQDRWTQLMGPDLADPEPVGRSEAAECDATVLVGYHYSQTMRLTRVAAAHGATAVVPTAHPEGAFHVGAVGDMFSHADAVISLAPEEGELVRRTWPQSPPVTVVPCPVEPMEPPPDAMVDATLAGLGLRRGSYAVVVGRVDPAKGSDDAIRFAVQYRRCVDPHFELVVIGPGGAGAPPEGVRATGFVDEPTKVALVAGAGVVVQPSYMESFSYALMEGWLLERPALVQRRSRVLAGHVERSGGGITYGDYPEFEAALVTLSERPDLSARLGAAGRRYVLDEFAWPVVADAFTAALGGIERRGGRRARPGDSISS
jgi:glycosyltransferase involved in cell wall biosynthesis